MMGADVRMHPHLLQMTPAERHLFRDRYMSVLEIAEATGIPIRTIYSRLSKGQPLDQPVARNQYAKRYLFRDQIMTVAKAARLTGCHEATIRRRISGNVIMEKHEIEPAFQILDDWGNIIRIITHRNKSNSIVGWSRETGLSPRTILSRLRLGWTVADVLTRPVKKRVDSRSTERNRRLIRELSSRFRSIRNRLLIHRIVSAFHTHTGGYDQTSPHTLGTGLGRRAVERGQNENPFPTENRRASA